MNCVKCGTPVKHNAKGIPSNIHIGCWFRMKKEAFYAKSLEEEEKTGGNRACYHWSIYPVIRKQGFQYPKTGGFSSTGSFFCLFRKQ